MRPGPRWSQSEAGPHAREVGASVVPKQKRPPRPCGGGLGGPKAKEASPMQWAPRWSQSEGGPLAHAVGASVVPKRRRPHHVCGGGAGDSKAKEAPMPMWLGLGLGSPSWWNQSWFYNPF